MAEGQCQAFYRTEDGKEMQCPSKKAWPRRIKNMQIRLCPEHCRLFFTQIYPIEPLKLNSSNMARLARVVFGEPDIEIRVSGGYEIPMIIKTLQWHEQTAIIYRFGLDGGRARTLAEVANMMGVSRERVRQIEAKALRKLRHPLRSKIIREYLKI